MKILKKLRRQIDKVDQKLLKLLAQRFKISQKIGEYKKRYNMPALDKTREEKILKKNKMLAEKLALDAMLAEKIFKLVFKKVRQNHKKIKDEQK